MGRQRKPRYCRFLILYPPLPLSSPRSAFAEMIMQLLFVAGVLFPYSLNVGKQERKDRRVTRS